MGIPDRLLQSISMVESGRRTEGGGVAAWPWTINAEGAGSYFNTKAEAIAAVTALRARGVRSIDVGCMQVNMMFHPDAFSSLDEAFDPGANARYAARFLTRLMAQTGSWTGAAAGYHSLTPGIGEAYARKVLAVWAKPAAPSSPAEEARVQQASLQAWPPPSPAPPTPPSAAPPPPAGSTLSFGTARIIPIAAPIASASGGMLGRGLDAYRAMPTRLAGRFMPLRSSPS